MTNVNQAPLPRLSKAPLVRASLVKRRYIKYPALPFFLPFWLLFGRLIVSDLILQVDDAEGRQQVAGLPLSSLPVHQHEPEACSRPQSDPLRSAVEMLLLRTSRPLPESHAETYAAKAPRHDRQV